MTEHVRTNLTTHDGTPVPLREVEMQGQVLGGTLCMKIRQHYENVEAKPIEALYTFPVPSEATIVGFVMECSKRRLEASVQEREAAFESYHDALQAGDGAALLDQERANVFSASVGNLLPRESCVIEIEYVQRLHANEGALRIALPTLVAPRYMPGTARGPRTAHGWAEPTSRVPDADRISPPIGAADYRVSLSLLFAGARELLVSSPSHHLATSDEPAGMSVRFADGHVALDRDVVLLVEGAEQASLTSVLAHKQGEHGYLLLSHLPDLSAQSTQAPAQDVVFLLDCSGSMDGASLTQAQQALRLCLRQLREGDCFSILAFNHEHVAFRAKLVPFTQKTLEQADDWIDAINADGGTELLAPMLAALKLLRRGKPGRNSCAVLLTDGQVGNEDEIARAVLAKAGSTAIHAFGIGTSVSDNLLLQLAKRTHGGVELIHPGERIDDKVVSTFARAIAPRVRDLKLTWRDLEPQDFAPAEPPPLIDGEPWLLAARYRRAGRGALELRGTLNGAAWFLRLPISLPEQASLPAVPRLWARERVRDLEQFEIEHPDQSTQPRIVALATEHGIASRYTSFVVRETRSSERRAKEPAQARVVPVHAPAGWASFEASSTRLVGSPLPLMACTATPLPPSGPASFMSMRMLDADPGPASFAPASPMLARRAVEVPAEDADPSDATFAVFAAQLASGLWDEPQSAGDAELRQLRATTERLIALLRAGIDTSHPQHGPLVRKALGPLAQLAAAVAARAPELAERALAVAWLCASGARTKRSLRATIASAGLHALERRLEDHSALRAALLG